MPDSSKAAPRRKRVLDVGQCDPDHGSIRRMLDREFDVEIIRAHTAEEALQKLRNEGADLVLINRKLDIDYSDGIEILKKIKSDPKLAATPVMLVTNYAEYEAEAVAAGAVPGFGKAALDDPRTIDRLSAILG